MNHRPATGGGFQPGFPSPVAGLKALAPCQEASLPFFHQDDDTAHPVTIPGGVKGTAVCEREHVAQKVHVFNIDHHVVVCVHRTHKFIAGGIQNALDLDCECPVVVCDYSKACFPRRPNCLMRLKVTSMLRNTLFGAAVLQREDAAPLKSLLPFVKGAQE